MKSSELKLGHAYKVAGKEGPAFYVNCHPHDGASHIMAWHDSEEDEEKFFLIDACEIEYEIPAATELLVFTEQYEAFQLAGRVLQNLPQILEHVKAIESRAAEAQKHTVSGCSNWHAYETIDDRVHDLLTLLEEGDFNALTGAEKREAEMVELRRKAAAYDAMNADGDVHALREAWDKYRQGKDLSVDDAFVFASGFNSRRLRRID